MVLFSVGLGVGCSLGSWIAIGSIAAVRHGGWSAVANIPRKWVVFPVIPEWFHPAEVTVANILVSVLLLAGGAGGMMLGIHFWRHLVVKVFGWMTAKEVDEFLRRDPGF
jgi:hypothetical protein